MSFVTMRKRASSDRPGQPKTTHHAENQKPKRQRARHQQQGPLPQGSIGRKVLRWPPSYGIVHVLLVTGTVMAPGPWASRCAVLCAQEAAPGIPDESLDYVYIDGDHTIAGVIRDCVLWWPKLRPGGLFFGDDYVCGLTKFERSHRAPSGKWRQTCVKEVVDTFAALVWNVTVRSLGLDQYAIWKPLGHARAVGRSPSSKRRGATHARDVLGALQRHGVADSRSISVESLLS